MHEAKILHCEDNEGWRATVELVLSISGLHKVVAYAETLGDSLKFLQEIKNGGLDVNVVLLDGNLRGGMGLNHPKYILEKAKDLGLELPAIGLSMEGLGEKGLAVGRDIAADIKKEDLGADPGLLARTIHKLPEPS